MTNIDRTWIMLGIIAIGNTVIGHDSGSFIGIVSIAICMIAQLHHLTVKTK